MIAASEAQACVMHAATACDAKPVLVRTSPAVSFRFQHTVKRRQDGSIVEKGRVAEVCTITPTLPPASPFKLAARPGH